METGLERFIGLYQPQTFTQAMEPFRQQMARQQQMALQQQQMDQQERLLPLKEQLMRARTASAMRGPALPGNIQMYNLINQKLGEEEAGKFLKKQAEGVGLLGQELGQGLTTNTINDFAKKNNIQIDPDVQSALGDRKIGVSPLFNQLAVSAGTAKENEPLYFPQTGAKFIKSPSKLKTEYASKLAGYDDTINNYKKLLSVADQLGGLKGNFTKLSGLLSNIGLGNFQSPEQLKAWGQSQANQARAVEGSMRDDKFPRVKQTAELLKNSFDVVGGNVVVNKERIKQFLKAAQENHKRAQFYTEGIPTNEKGRKFIESQISGGQQQGFAQPGQQRRRLKFNPQTGRVE